jgi:hypothetical protein
MSERETFARYARRDDAVRFALVAVALAVLVAPEAPLASAPLCSARLSATPAPLQGAVPLTSAEECGRCHQDILRYWKASRHAQAADNPRLQVLLASLREKGVKDPPCVRCHAPAALYMRDPQWEKKVTWEGVTCDFCHSVRATRADAQKPFVLEVGRLKSGPLRDAKPTVHAASYSEVYSSSTLCAPCHQFTNDRHFDVLTTYSEWRASEYPARNVTCQTCHMRAVTGKVVDPKVARSSVSTVNVHEMPGGHSVVELNRALHAQIAAKRAGDDINVSVQVTNRGAGHNLPTGSPLRAIVLVVEASGGVGQTQSATRSYSRVVVDESGKELTDEATVWMTGGRVLRDDRLKPGERRTESFRFRIPRGPNARAVARFYYRYKPDATGRADLGTPFLQVTAWVPGDPQ